MSSPTLEHVDAGAWHGRVARGLADGATFAGAWASGRDRDAVWRLLLLSAGEAHVLSCTPDDGRVDSVVELVEAAGWDEREAHDLRGLTFTGHEPLRALAAHPEASGAWMTPVVGDGTHDVAVGPIHAGVIESGHFRFHVVGERILALDPRLFYKHRGLEQAAEGRTPDESLRYAQRACAACAVTNAMAYAHAAESALGLWPDRGLRRERTLLLELERLYNHLHDIGAICAGVGFAPGALAFAALKERAQRVNASALGHRFLFDRVALGRGTLSLDDSGVRAVRSALRDLRVDSAAAWRELEFARTLQARLGGIGVLANEDARRLGAVGPAARAAGLRDDARGDAARLWYGAFVPATLASTRGDVAARLQLRAVELETTYDLLDELLERPIEPGAATSSRQPAPIGVGRVESPRGATICAVELDAGRIARVHLRTGSYANWPALAQATAGNLLPDFPLINKSFELCYACVDR